MSTTELIDTLRLENQVKRMYEQVARRPDGHFHFEMGRGLAERLGYPPALLTAIPAEALASFAGVGLFFDLAQLAPGERVVDLGSGSGTDLFSAAVQVGRRGSATGVDMTGPQLEKAARLAREGGFTNVALVESRLEDTPLEDASADVVISNGVINLCPDKQRAFDEVARVLRPGGRLALSDIVSGRELAERTRANTDLWAACIAGAIPQQDYLDAIEAAGLTVERVRENRGYRFISERALAACDKYEVRSVSVLARRR
jgi:SAM-dependent methyltransferase